MAKKDEKVVHEVHHIHSGHVHNTHHHVHEGATDAVGAARDAARGGDGKGGLRAASQAFRGMATGEGSADSAPNMRGRAGRGIPRD